MTVLAFERPASSLDGEARYEERRTEPERRQREECPRAAFDPDGRSCKRRDCYVCGARWARRWSQVFLHNLLHNGGSVAMISVTAPGVEAGLLWDKSRCRSKRPHSCTGPFGCVVERAAAREWSKDAPARWAALRDAARKAAQRRTGLPLKVLGRVWEPQKRGVPHLHVVVDCTSADDLAVSQAFLEELQRLTPLYGFGYVDRELKPGDPNQAARYVADYLTGRQRRAARAKKTSIRENIAADYMPRSLLWISPKLTGATKVTMRNLRYVGWYFAAVERHVDVYPRLFGAKLLDVLTAIVFLEKSRRRRGPPVDEDERQRWKRHYDNLRQMRAIQPPYEWRSLAA